MWTTKPPYGTLLDPSNPFTAGLGACFTFAEACGNPYDLVSGQAIVRAGTTTWGLGPSAQVGSNLAGNASTGTANGTLPLINSWTTFSTAILWMCPASPTPTTSGRIVEKGANNDWAITISNASALKIGCQVGATITMSSASNLVDGTWHMLVLTYDGATARLYVDGAFNASGTAAGKVGTANPLNLFKFSSSNSFSTNSHLSGLWIWQNRVLTPGDAFAHYSSPWQMFIDEDDYLVYSPAATIVAMPAMTWCSQP